MVDIWLTGCVSDLPKHAGTDQERRVRREAWNLDVARELKQATVIDGAARLRTQFVEEFV